jgi:hypothetical protein
MINFKWILWLYFSLLRFFFHVVCLTLLIQFIAYTYVHLKEALTMASGNTIVANRLVSMFVCFNFCLLEYLYPIKCRILVPDLQSNTWMVVNRERPEFSLQNCIYNSTTMISYTHRNDSTLILGNCLCNVLSHQNRFKISPAETDIISILTRQSKGDD